MPQPMYNGNWNDCLEIPDIEGSDLQPNYQNIYFADLKSLCIKDSNIKFNS